MPRLRTIALILIDTLLMLGCYVLATSLLINFEVLPDLTLETYFIWEEGYRSVLFLVMSIVFGFYFMGFYESHRGESRLHLVEDTLLVFGGAFLLQALVSYSKTGLVISRWVMLFGSLLSAVAFLAWRVFYNQMLVPTVGRERAFFLGDTPLARQIGSEILGNPHLGFQIAGYTADRELEVFPGAAFYPLEESLDEKMIELAPDYICAAIDLVGRTELRAMMLNWSMRGLNVQNAGDLYERIYQRVSLETITLDQLVFSSIFRQDRWTIRLQTLYSFAIAALGVLLTAPAMALVALAVRLDSAGPILFRQIRIGRDGIPFTFLKFRSMYTDADKLTGPVRARENDSRITRVGRFIRLSRLDELPQLINVLRGEMALVGPRPEMPEFEKELVVDIPLYPQRHRVKPGITGWAQIHHTPEDSLDSTRRKLEYDLYYIKHLSPVLDFLTMFHTFKTIVMRIGAR